MFIADGAPSEDRGKPGPYYTRAWQADASCIVGAYPCGRPGGLASNEKRSLENHGGSVMQESDYVLYPIGFLQSPLKEPGEAPRQGREGAPDAWLEVNASVAEGLEALAVGDEIIVITWLHKAQRDILKVHPRGDETVPLAGVFATRSPDRPNPLGLHRVTVLEIAGARLKVGPIEAIDGTPVVDIKPVLPPSADS